MPYVLTNFAKGLPFGGYRSLPAGGVDGDANACDNEPEGREKDGDILCSIVRRSKSADQ